MTASTLSTPAIFQRATRMYEFEAERASAKARTVVWIVAIGTAHFLLGTRAHSVHGLHVVLAGLFLIPVLIASGAFAVRGGILAAAAVSAVYVSHLLWSWRDSAMANPDQYGMVGVYFTVGIAAGRLAAIVNWRRAQRDEVIRRANAAERAGGSVHP